MSEVFVSTADEIHVDVVIPSDEAIVGIEVGVQGPQGPRGVPGPVGPFTADAILVGAGTGGVAASVAGVNPVDGNLFAPGISAMGADSSTGGLWVNNSGSTEWWGWYGTSATLHLGRWDSTTPLGDVLIVDYATGLLTVSGDIYAGSLSALGVGSAGGLWWNGGALAASWAWYEAGGAAHLGRWNVATPLGDALTIDHATGAVTAPGDVYGLSFTTRGVAEAGGYWIELDPGRTAWALIGPAVAGDNKLHLARYDTGVYSDALTVDYTTGVVNLPNGATAPTPSPGDNDTSVATTAFVQAALAAAGGATGDITSVTAGSGLTGGGTSGAVTLSVVDSLNLTGTPTAPTPAAYPAPGSNSTILATTAFVTGAVATGVSGIPAPGISQLTGNVTAGPGSGSQVATIAAGAVTYARMQNVAASRLLGNPTGSAAAPSEITLGANLTFAAGVLNAASGGSGTINGVTAGAGLAGGGTSGTVTLSTSVPSANKTTNYTVVAGDLGGTLILTGATGILTLPAAIFTPGSRLTIMVTGTSGWSVTNSTGLTMTGLTSTLQGGTSGTFIANADGTTINFISGLQAPANATTLGGAKLLTATANNFVTGLNISGILTTAQPAFSNLTGSIAVGQITDASVTYAKIQNVAANRLLGNSTGSAAAPAEIALPLAVALGGTGVSTAATAPWVEVAGDQMTGNLGIGITPVSRLHVATADTSAIAIVAGTTKAVRIGADAGTSYVEGVDNTGIGSYQPLTVSGSYVRFSTSTTERMRLDTNGWLGINTTAPNTPLEIKTDNQSQLRLDRNSAVTRKEVIEFTSQGNLNYQVGNDINNNATQTFFVYDNRASAIRLEIDGAGACFNTSGTWSAISDASIKSDVRPYERGLEAILALNPVAYRYNASAPFAGSDETVRYGLIAQEVEPHVPEAVGTYEYVPEAVGKSGEPALLSTLDPGSLIYVLINAVKELSAKVEALEGVAAG